MLPLGLFSSPNQWFFLDCYDTLNSTVSFVPQLRSFLMSAKIRVPPASLIFQAKNSQKNQTPFFFLPAFLYTSPVAQGKNPPEKSPFRNFFSPPYRSSSHHSTASPPISPSSSFHPASSFTIFPYSETLSVWPSLVLFHDKSSLFPRLFLPIKRPENSVASLVACDFFVTRGFFLLPSFFRDIFFYFSNHSPNSPTPVLRRKTDLPSRGSIRLGTHRFSIGPRLTGETLPRKFIP